jgi:hypothetical protein
MEDYFISRLWLWPLLKKSKASRLVMFPSSGEHLRKHTLDLLNGQSCSQSLFPIKLLKLVRNYKLFSDNMYEISWFLLIRCAWIKSRSKISEQVLVVLMWICREFVKDLLKQILCWWREGFESTVFGKNFENPQYAQINHFGNIKIIQ